MAEQTKPIAAAATPKAASKEPKVSKTSVDFSSMTSYEIFKWVQDNIKVGKTRYNAFAKFNYRSVEDIYTAWDALKVPLVLKLTDEVIEKAGRAFVEATAEVKDLKGNVVEWAKAQAELGTGKAGMSSEQATGSASSYARKYALNGLFLLDDSKDVDEGEVPSGTSVTPTTTEKIKELQSLIRGNPTKTAKATTLLSGRSLLKLTEGELDEIIKAIK